MRAVGRRTERTAPVVFGAVEATAASAREEADDMPSSPAAAHDELDYNVMQCNILRDSFGERLGIGQAAKRPPATGLLRRCRRRPPRRFVEARRKALSTTMRLPARAAEPFLAAHPAANASEMICLASSWILRRCSVPLKLSA